MTVEANKQLIRDAFEAMGRSDIRPLVELMSDDFAWIIEGQSRFSRSYGGKEAVKRDLLAPLFEALATPYRFTIDEIIGEGDRVVVRGRGEVKTKAGKDYNNSYCFVLRLADGKLVELREYLRHGLVERVSGRRIEAGLQDAEAGMADMSKRFHDEGREIYLPAGRGG